ncbi:OLC1v1029475C1 [Oldenlandia corymbosa var. corymbosa]|uniref:OLC1v1029475C1 n=1 Tax=Oldenlandia corymbosa var. corymbosa TaxID=529605 RepID=A0AAV1CGX4_OLDCO|nr:OLC1v1029475C1 [Oldenlandia corymbosa var. corymbosa]
MIEKFHLQLLHMGFSYCSVIVMFFLLLAPASSTALQIETQGIKSARLLDLVIRDYTFQTYDKSFGTGKLHTVSLPANLSGIKVDTIRFRCGSLRRYGARLQQFQLSSGLTINPCIERVLIVAQNLGSNWSSIYYDNYELSGYQLISPVLGLLAYNAGDNINFSSPFEVSIQSSGRDDLIKIDFTNTSISNPSSGIIPLCARFEHDGKVTLSNQQSPNVCVTSKQGHFGLVVESPLIPFKKKASKWKIAIGSSIGAALGAFLLTLLLIALFVKVKKKARMEELERRAYEEEALQVSMVGHIRAPTASTTRTVPVIEHEFIPPPPHRPHR